jgi:hypothetical protein
MEITVWTLVTDTDSGTHTSVFPTQHQAEEAYLAAIFIEDDEIQRKAKEALDAGNYAQLHDIAQGYIEGGIDTFGVDYHTIEVETQAEKQLGNSCHTWNCACVRAYGQACDCKGSAAPAVALPPADRAALNSLPSDPEDMNDARAEWAGDALAYFARKHGEEEEGCEAQNLADLLADLAHYCDRNGLSLDGCLTTAQMHYAEETDHEGAQFDR